MVLDLTTNSIREWLINQKTDLVDPIIQILKIAKGKDEGEFCLLISDGSEKSMFCKLSRDLAASVGKSIAENSVIVVKKYPLNCHNGQTYVRIDDFDITAHQPAKMIGQPKRLFVRVANIKRNETNATVIDLVGICRYKTQKMGFVDKFGKRCFYMNAYFADQTGSIKISAYDTLIEELSKMQVCLLLFLMSQRYSINRMHSKDMYYHCFCHTNHCLCFS